MSFFARVQAIAQNVQAPTITTSFVPKLEAKKPAPMRDTSDVIADMGDWCNDVHSLPDMGEILQIDL